MPTLNDLPPRPVDENESVTQPVLDHSIKPTTPPDAANASTLSPTVRNNVHGLARGHAAAYICANTSLAHHHSLPGRRMNESAYLPSDLRTSARTLTRVTRTRTRTTDPTRPPTHLRVLSTTFRMYQVILQSRRAQASFAMEEGVEIALCRMKQRILLSLFRTVYQVVISFRSYPTRVV